MYCSKNKARLGALAVVAAAVSLVGCVSWNAVPLREGAFARGAVQVGEDVRGETRNGEEVAFTVTGVEEGSLTGDQGERVPAGDLQSLEVRRMDKVKTIILFSVLGGVVATAYVLDVLDDCSYSDGEYFCVDP